MVDENTQQPDESLPPEWLSDAPVTDPPKRSLLRQLAADPDSGLVELADGVWYQPKPRPDRDKLS